MWLDHVKYVGIIQQNKGKVFLIIQSSITIISNHSDSHLFTVIKSNDRGKQSHRCLLFTPL